MGRQPIPDDQQLAIHLPLRVSQEVEGLWCVNGAAIEPKVELLPGDPGDRRQHVPVEAQLQHGRLPTGCPGPHSMRLFAQSRFVDEDDRAAFGRDVVVELMAPR